MVGDRQPLVHSQQCIRRGEPNVPSQKKGQLQPCTKLECTWRHSGESIRTGIVQMIANGYAKLGVKSGWDPGNRTGTAQMSAYLKKFLKNVGLSDSEQRALSKSMHSFRAGVAICKILEGDSLEKAYWKCPATALHSLKVMEVLCPMGMAKPGISLQDAKPSMICHSSNVQKCARLMHSEQKCVR